MLRVKHSKFVSNWKIMVHVKPCPFCYSQNIEHWYDHLRCGVCKTKGPIGSTEEEAILFWNERGPRNKSDYQCHD